MRVMDGRLRHYYCVFLAPIEHPVITNAEQSNDVDDDVDEGTEWTAIAR